VDAFQGGEKDVMLVSTVRAGSGEVGFIDDPRRLNVALTRGRCHLIIFGDRKTLMNHSALWRKVLEMIPEN
jgi:ATP-dependent RNA/DNA helicase IGHMBP2